MENPSFLRKFRKWLGTGLLVLVIGLGLCMVVPNFFGIQLFNVVSGSMEPAIPVGSLVAVQYEEPDSIAPPAVIAFIHRGSVITHRLIENDIETQELITKGDANAQNDMEPIPYSDLIGVVRFHIPFIGALFAALSSLYGKIFLLCLAILGVLLCR